MTQNLKDWLNPDTWLNMLSRINAPRRRERVRSPQGYAYAGLNRRIAAAACDAALIAFCLSPFNAFILAYAYAGVHWDPAAFQAAGAQGPAAWQTQWQIVQDSGVMRALGRLMQIQFTVLAVYSFLFWRTLGATPGKLLLRLRLVDIRTDEKISDMQGALRLLGYLLSALPLGAGFFAIEWDACRQGWHDKLARTAVVALPWRKPAK